MKNPEQLFFDIAQRFAEQSKCKSRHVGCIIAYEHRVIGQGYNGAPEGSDCDQCPRPRCRGNKDDHPSGTQLELALCTHAEANAIGYCARHGIVTRGATMYITVSPCPECAKLMVAAGIKQVTFMDTYPLADFAREILQRAGVRVDQHYPKT